MLYGRTLLLIYPIWTNLHLILPNSQSFPPLAITGLFSIPMRLFLFCRYVHLCHILDPTYKRYYMVSFFLFLTYLHLVCASLGPSTLLRMAVFHSFLGGCFNCWKNYQSFFQDGHAIWLPFQWCESIQVARTAWPTPVVKHVSLFKIVASF